jgi:hypothetical protein
MKKNLIYLFIGVVIGAFLINQCSQNENITISTPEIVNKVTDTVVYHYEVDVYKEVPKWYKDTKNEKELKLELQERENRLKDYKEGYEMALNDFTIADSLLKIEKFKNATELRNFESIKEDEFIILNTKGIVSGEVKEIETFYKIKSQNYTVPIKSKNFSLSAGVGADFINNAPVVKIGAGYKNYKFDYLPSQKIGIITYEIKF